MPNPILVLGLLPYDELYLSRSGPRWRFRALRHVAAGAAIFTELAACDHAPKMLAPGDWHEAGPLDLRDWTRYGLVNGLGLFISVEEEAKLGPPRHAEGQQLALALGGCHG